MTLFALTISYPLRMELRSAVQALFALFVLASFISVVTYVTQECLAGQFFTPNKAPLPVRMKPFAGFFFIISVLGMIFLQSPLYALLVVMGIISLLAENGMTLQTQFGLTRLNPVRAVAWSMLLFGAVMLIETPVTIGSAWALDVLGVPHPEQEAVETFRQYDHLSTVVSFMFQAVLVVPIIEEFFFRGFLLTFLKNYTSIWLAIILSGGVFAFAHLNLGAVIPLWLLGIILGVAYEHTGSLLLPIGVHACFNLATGLSLLLDKTGN